MSTQSSRIFSLCVVLIFCGISIADQADWSWQLASSRVDIVPLVPISFTISAPASSIECIVQQNVTHNVLISWNETYSWFIPAPARSQSDTVKLSTSVPFLTTPSLNISILDPLTNDTIHSEVPQFSQLATSYVIVISPLDDAEDLIFVNATSVVLACDWLDDNGASMVDAVWATQVNSSDLFTCIFEYSNLTTYAAGQFAAMEVLRTFSDSNSTEIPGSANFTTGAIWNTVDANGGSVCGNSSANGLLSVNGAFNPNRTYACVVHGLEDMLSNFTVPSSDGKQLLCNVQLPPRPYGAVPVNLYFTQIYELEQNTNITRVIAPTGSTNVTIGIWKCIKPWYLRFLIIIVVVPAGLLMCIIILFVVLVTRKTAVELEETKPLRDQREIIN